MFPLFLTKIQNHNYNIKFQGERSIRENIWRRHQCQDNAKLSLWNSECDQRIKLLHYRDEYEIINKSLYLKNCYLFITWKVTENELRKGVDKITYMLNNNEWTKAQDEYYNDSFIINLFIKTCTNNYKQLDFIFRSSNYEPDAITIASPWICFSKGIRKIKPACLNPKIITPNQLKNFMPCQLELGSGPSIESGIPALKSLHEKYHIWQDGHFNFDINDDRLICNLIKNPKNAYKDLINIHIKSVNAKPSSFYIDLIKLFEKKCFVEEIFTNNFDGICLALGLKEHYMRKYDKLCEYPNYEFHPEAKSLLVIGSHADRRQLQQVARNKNLPIIFVDPETLNKEPYPIEAIQPEDFLIRETSSKFTKKLLKII